MKISYEPAVPAQIPAGAFVLVPCFADSDIQSLIQQAGGDKAVTQRIATDFTPDTEDTLSLFEGDKRIELVGVKEKTYQCLNKALQSFSAKFRRKKSPSWILFAGHITDAHLIEAALNGILIGLYDPGLYKSSHDEDHTGTPAITVVNATDHVADAGRRAVLSAETQKEIMGMVNAPSNRKNPESMAKWARRSGEKHGYNVRVYDERKLEKEGFNALLAVNRGSEFPARLIVSDYSPDDAQKCVAFVGKGVTFDTGGVSIKPSNNMHYMKSDMGGAAAALGAVELAAKLKLPIRVLAIVPATDNSVDARAIKPGDVIDSYSGQTIEVINTDAEGRLILADALAFAIEKYRPDILIDLATLTGSVVRALGNHCAGLFTHNSDLAAALEKAGESVGERLWRLPLWDTYAEDMRSEIADIRNLGDKPVAGAITAAKFLEHFVSEHKAWAHLDIAGMAYKPNGTSRNHTATAFGVRLLVEYLRNLGAS